MAKRNTIQRQLVIAAVRFLADHPTAEEVYDRITMEYPDISKGTVYRNLNSLVESGLLSKVSVPSGADRFECGQLPVLSAVKKKKAPPCPAGQGALRGCGGDAVCPGGAKALLCGAPDFGGSTGKSALRGGLPFRKGWQARREDGGA